MPLADTTGTPVFITTEPDWSRDVFVRTSWRTGGTTNREGGAQRTKVMQAPKLSIEYVRQAITPQQFALRRAEAVAQAGAAVVVPVWTEYGTASSFGTHSVTLNAAITSLKYKVGSWVYVKQGASACFRKIVSVATPVISLSSSGADIYPVGFTWAVFTAGARVYPCILGVKNDNRFSFVLRRTDRAAHVVGVDEL